MKLHEAIKQLVTQFGESVVTEVRLANLLADLNGYQDYPAMKTVFKEVLKAGYGQDFYSAYKTNPQKALNEEFSLIKKIATETRFKEDLISYSLDCILFAIGGITIINEPFSKGFDPYSSGPSDVLNNLSSQLSALKKQYIDMLDRLPTLPNNILRDAPGYYSTKALNQLYAIEAKIVAILQETNTFNEFKWCEQKRKEKLESFKREKTDALVKSLNPKKDEYIQSLKILLVIPHNFFIKKSGYYNRDGEQKLNAIEEDIKLIYYNMGKSYNNWCENEKAKHLSKYKVNTGNIARQIFLKIILPIIIIFGSGNAIISYMSSSNDIDRFEQSIADGEQLVSEGDYAKALQVFSSARLNYNASFRTSHYKNIACKYIDSSIDNAVKKSLSLTSNGKLAESNDLLNSLSQEIVSENPQNLDKYNKAKTELSKAVENGLNNIIGNISNNNGKLDAKGRDVLNELLKINPNDYWLNFIKNKEK